MKLVNFYFRCKCGKYLAFHTTEEIQGCPKCMSILRLPKVFINYLLTRERDGKEELA